jgi:hypothetical protein
VAPSAASSDTENARPTAATASANSRAARELPERRADHCPEVRWWRDAARRQRPGALDREQRVSLGRCDHLRERAVGQCRDAARDLRHLRGGQRAELDLSDVEPAASEVGQQRVGVGAVRSVPAGEHEQHRQVGESPADVRAQGEARAVRAVQVFGHEQHRALRRGPLDQAQDGVEEAQPLQLGRRHDRRRGGAAERARQVGCEPAQLSWPADGRRRRGHHTDQGAGELLPHRERCLAPDVHAGADGDPRPDVVGAPGQLADQPGLADPGLADDEYHLPVPAAGRRPRCGERGQLPDAPEHRAPQARPHVGGPTMRLQPGQHRPGRRGRAHA